MKILFFFVALILSNNSFASECINKISTENAVKAIAGQATEAILCKPTDRCICFDHVTDWQIVKLENSEIVTDQQKRLDKIAAEEAAKNQAAAKERAARDRKEFLQSYKGKNLTEAELRDAVSMLIDAVVE
jgi:hypothetical protein